VKELYEETDKCASFLDELYQDEQRFKKTWANQAKRWIAFSNGDQNPYPTGAPIMVGNQPVNYQNESRQNTYQANEIEPIVRTLVSYMTRSKPMVDCFPASDDEQDKNVSRVSQVLTEAKYDLDNESTMSRRAAWWSIVTGTVFRKDYWDPEAGSPLYDLDEQGNQLQTASKKTGGNAVAILTPFTFGCDHAVTEWENHEVLWESYVMPVEWARSAFDQDAPGYTGKASGITEGSAFSDTLGMLEDIKYAIPNLTTGSGSRMRPKGKVLVRENYIKPCSSMPTGRMLVKVGDVVVYDSETNPEGNPYYMPFEPMMWHPYSMFGFEPYLGRFLHKSLVEQLVPLQMRLNEINGAILENANTMAKPNIMAAEKQLRKGVLNGMGANVYTYQVVPGAQPPFVMPGTPLPQQFFEEKKEIIEHMVRIAGTNFTMQGNTPKGVTAAAAIQMLLENATTQHGDMMTAWEKFHESGFTKKLRVIHKFHTAPDKNIEKYVRVMNKDILDGQLKDFIGTRDLSDGVTLKVQYGSMTPKSQVFKRDMYKDFAKQGLLGPIGEDSPRGAKMRDQMFEILGEKPLESDESIEVKKAKWENDRIMRGEPVEVSPYDNHMIHGSYHKSRIQDPKFLENATDEQKIALDNHIQEHDAAMQPPMPPPQADGAVDAQGMASPHAMPSAAPTAAMPSDVSGAPR
jgi:hypothetical protein